jgi:hypothetical protein
LTSPPSPPVFEEFEDKLVDVDKPRPSLKRRIPFDLSSLDEVDGTDITQRKIERIERISVMDL